MKEQRLLRLTKVTILLMSLLWLAIPLAQVEANIRVEPGTTVEVGEEVYFDALDSGYDGSMVEGSLEWDFGDGYFLEGGTSVTHFYMRAGTYTVTLSGTGLSGGNKTVAIHVAGESPKSSPRLSKQMILELKFEGNLDNTSESGLVAQWQGGAGAFADGPGGQAADLTNGAYIEVLDPGGVLSGMDELIVEMWVKKKEDFSTGYLLDMNGAYNMWLYEGWADQMIKQGQNVMEGNVMTGSGGSAKVKNPNMKLDTLWHHYAIRYDGTIVRLFIDEVEYVNAGKAPTALSGMINVSSDSLLIGKKSDEPNIFNGYIDEVRIYKKAIEEFELWHADFHGHIAQYIYAQIPEVYMVNNIKVTLEGDNGYSAVLIDKFVQGPEEKFLLRNSELPRGNYTLNAQILDLGGDVLDELTEKFEKPYDGIPKVGIDENNAIRVDGELFFPVTPWLLRIVDVPDWASKGYINTLLGEQFSRPHTLSSWKGYLDEGYENDLVAIGPGAWEGKGPKNYESYSDVNMITEFVDGTKDHDGLLMWFWDDEPTVGPLPSSVLRSWTYLSHKQDPQHLVAVNYAGARWTYDEGYYFTKRRKFEYLYNAGQFGGKKTHITDVIGIDYYPIDWRKRPLLLATVAKLADALDTLREENYNLLPYMSFVETEDIRDDTRDKYGDRRYDPDMTPPATPEQLKMLIWLNVVHGVKGINWFNHFNDDYAQDNYPVMAEFLDHITQLTPVVLGPETDRNIQDNANEPGNRVDTMVREHEGNIYIFAVRLTEVLEAGDSPITVTFNVEGINNAVAEVFDESRTINAVGGSFQDTFAPNGVHIYKIIPKEQPYKKESNKTELKCYNNVFNPTKGEEALIWVEIKEKVHIKLALYDSRGRKIKKIADEKKEPPLYKYHWDGTNDSGNVVGSGLYFVHIQAEDYKKTKKIVVVK